MGSGRALLFCERFSTEDAEFRGKPNAGMMIIKRKGENRKFLCVSGLGLSAAGLQFRTHFFGKDRGDGVYPIISS